MMPLHLLESHTEATPYCRGQYGLHWRSMSLLSTHFILSETHSEESIHGCWRGRGVVESIQGWGRDLQV